MSGFLFLLVIDYIMRKTNDGFNNGIRWKISEKLDDLDYADDLALVSSTLSHCQSKLTRLKNTAEKAGLKINTDKTKSMRFKARSRTLMTVGSEEIENTNQFKYLGSVITSDGDSHKDISIRTGKAWGAYNKLRPIRRSNQLSKKTKLSVYRACVMSVLLYGCESWGMAKH